MPGNLNVIQKGCIASWRRRLAARTRRGESGFTLMEVLVAFTIFSVSFTAILQILSASTRNDEIAEQYGLAVSHAESLLARAGVESPLAAGESFGDLDGEMRWHQVVTLYGNETSAWPADDIVLVPYRVEVTVSWGEGNRARSLSLSTLRLGGSG